MIKLSLCWALLGLASFGLLVADERGMRESPFKALDSRELTEIDAHMDMALVGIIEAADGFHALIKLESGRVVRVRVGEQPMEGFLVTKVWANGVRITTPEGAIELTLAALQEALP